MRKLLLALALFLPSALFAQCNTKSFVDYESGTIGGNVTTALLASSTHGYATTWSIVQPSSTSIVFSSTANQPLYTPTGVLCGDSVNYAAGAGTKGIEFVGTGIGGANEIEIASGNLPAALRSTHFREAQWFCFQFPFTDGSINYDIFDVHPLGGNFTAVNVHSLGTNTTTYLNMETGDGNGPTTIPIDFTSTHGTSCTFPNGFPDLSAPWYKLVITLGVSGGEPHSLFVYNTKGGLVGSVSLASTNTQPATSVYTAGGGVTSTVPVGENVYVDSWELATFSTPLDTPSCTGSSPTWTATPDQTSVQSCVTSAIAGDTVNATAGVATWAAGAVSKTLSGKLTLQGATSCATGCSAGSEGVALAFNDLTKIQTTATSSNVLTINGCTTTNVFRLTGFSFTNAATATGGLPGQIHINCTHGQTNAARIDHNNWVNNIGGTFLALDGGWGLIDHNLYNTNGNAYSFTQFGGDFSSSGYLDWQNATNPGTAESWILEDNNFNTTNSASAMTDGQYGCKITIRHNQFNGMPGGQVHGTDSGGYRGCVIVENYNNKYTSISIGFSPWNGSRSGAVLFHDNVLTGASIWNGIHVDFFRGSASDFGVAGAFGITCTNCNWTPINTSQNVINPQAPAWATGAHAANSIVKIGTCNAWTAAGGTSSGSVPACPALGSTVTDSGGVVWKNIGGSTSAPAGSTGTNAGFLNTDNETTCTTGGTCTRFFDTSATNGYPGRDQPGLIHGQCLYGSYQWNNSGAQVPANFWSTDASTYEQLGRDFFNSIPGTNCGKSAYAPYAYPDPLQGAAPIATFTPPSPIAFGNVPVNTTSSPVSVTLQNTGTLNLVNTFIQMSNVRFSIINNTCGSPATITLTIPGTGFTLAPTATCTFQVIAQPTNIGVFGGSASFSENTATSPDVLTFSMTGTGSVIFLNPNSLNFGNQTVGTTSAFQTVTLQNTGNITMTGISILSVDPVTFPLQNGGAGSCVAAGNTLAAGSSCTFQVAFHPSAQGVVSNSISVTSSATNSPSSVSLSGNGVILVGPTGCLLNPGVFINGGTSIQ